MIAYLFPKGDVVLCEGGTPLVESSLAKGNRGKMLLIAADPTFYQLHSMKGTEKEYWKSLLEEIDGVIAVSELAESDVKAHTSCPVGIVYPYADVKRYTSVRSDLGSTRIVFLGWHTLYKGVDLLLSAFKIVRREVNDAELFVLGDGPLRRWVLNQNIKGVRAPGYASRPEEFFSRASVYLHPARYDPFPVAVIEAMCSGLIPIITENVGSKEIVQKVYDRLIVKTQPKEIAERVIEVLNRPLKDKMHLSSMAMEEAKQFTKERSLAQFTKAFKTILSSSGQGREALQS